MGKLQGHFYNIDGEYISVEINANTNEDIEISNEVTMEAWPDQKIKPNEALEANGYIMNAHMKSELGFIVELPWQNNSSRIYGNYTVTNLLIRNGWTNGADAPLYYYYNGSITDVKVGLVKDYDSNYSPLTSLNYTGSVTLSQDNCPKDTSWGGSHENCSHEKPWGFVIAKDDFDMRKCVIDFTIPNGVGYFFYKDFDTGNAIILDFNDISRVYIEPEYDDVGMFFSAEPTEKSAPDVTFRAYYGNSYVNKKFSDFNWYVTTNVLNDNGVGVKRTAGCFSGNKKYLIYFDSKPALHTWTQFRDYTTYIDQQNSIDKSGILNSNFGDSVKFAADPITIEENLSSTFDHVIKTTASINLVTTKYLGDLLWAGNIKDAKVKITGPAKNNLDGKLFIGFLKPNTYTQPFANFIEEITLNAVDSLAILDNVKYNGTTPTNFEEKLGTTNNISFFDLIMKMRHFADDNIQIYWDTSIEGNPFRMLVSENFLYGETYKDCMTYGEILEQIMQYLNLHIKVIDGNWYMFNWKSLKYNTTIRWTNLISGMAKDQVLGYNYISYDKSAANDANITIEEVFNKIQVKCELETVDTIIDSPLDSKALLSMYETRKLYCREYLLEHKNDPESFRTLVIDQYVPDKTFKLTDWYVQVMQAKHWKFNWGNQNYVDKLSQEEYLADQTKIIKEAQTHYCSPLLLSVTKVENPTNREDNSIDVNSSKKTQLYFNVNGGCYLRNRAPVGSSDGIRPYDSDLTNNNNPFCEYKSPRTGSILSPTDDSTTNYLVFSGKLILQGTPYNYPESFTFGGVTYTIPYDYIPIQIFNSGNYNKVLLGGNSMYSRRYLSSTATNSPSKSNMTSTNSWTSEGLFLNGMHKSATDKDYKGTKYEYNWTYEDKRHADNGDHIAKLPVFECELIVGNKRLIEYDRDSEGNSKFKWVQIGYEPTEYIYDSTGNYTTEKVKTFTLGINPKIGDFIIGQEYDFQNTVTFDMNIDAKGIAIPIKADDALSGQVIFRILSICDIVYDDVDYKHGTWFRKKKFTSNVIQIMKNVSNIVLTDFKCEIFSDNGGYDSAQQPNKDLVYVSDVSTITDNTKDNITFKFVTQPTGEECRAKGLKNSILKNSILVYDNDGYSSKVVPVTTITSFGQTAKPEEHYIDAYYEEYSVPKLILEQTLKARGVVEWSRYHMTLLDKDFYIINKSRNVMDNTITCKFKEI